MKGLKKILALLIVLAFCMGISPVSTPAAELQQDGLRVELKADRSEYKEGEDIGVTLIVTNTSEQTISNVSMENLVPDGYKLTFENQASKVVDEIGAGETVTLETIFVPMDSQMAGTGGQQGSGGTDDNQQDSEDLQESSQNGNQQITEQKVSKNTVDTGDHSNVAFWGVVCALAVCLIIGILIWKKRSARKCLSLLLVAALAGTSFGAVPAKAAPVSKTININEQVKVGDKDVVLTSVVTYDWEENQEPPSEDTSNVTREEWIVALAEAIGLEGISDGQHSYDDFADAESPEIIEAAVRMGIVPIEPDEDNMVYFHPDANASREFAAYSAVHALNYQLDENVSADWADFSETEYPQEAVKAVEAEIFQVTDNHFNPKEDLTQIEKQNALKRIMEIEGGVSGDGNGNVEYADGVELTTLTYVLDEENKIVTTEDTAKTQGWQVGEIHALFSEDGLEKDIAIKITNITENNGIVTIQYEEPTLSEVVTSFDMEGTESTEGEFIPAEGVTVVDEEASTAAYSSRATAHGSLKLFGKKKISINVGDISCSGSIDFKDLEYRFSASPSWHLITINDAYLALNTSFEYDLSYMRDLNNHVDQKIKLGTFKCPFGYGFNGAGDIYLVVTAEGGLEIGVELDSKLGLQYSERGGLRPVYEMDKELKSLKIKGALKGGLAFECGAEFLGIDLVTVGAEGGLALDGEADEFQLSPLQFCLDGKIYIYLGIYGRVGWEDLNIRYDHEILNSDNSIFMEDMHFEETGLVDACTRGSGNYDGYVKDAQTNQPIENVKIQMVKNGDIKDTTYTDHTGKYTGINLKSGSYQLRVSAPGYRPSELDVTIVGGTTTTLETQFLVKRGTEPEGTVSCFGTVTDAVTGSELAGVNVSAKSLDLGATEEVASATTNDNGQYELILPAGQYKLTFTKSGYVTNYSNVSALENKEDVNISLNPENQAATADSFRVVLHWGNTVRDLDSHLWGPQGDVPFHIYFSNKVAQNANLDVDDTTYFGPETITVEQKEAGTYSYYIHDYTNRNKTNSNALSMSEAYVELYSGNELLYTIHIPENNIGTVWHVFDIDGATGQVTLINEFSNESNSQNVGNSLAVASLEDAMVPLKDYEIQDQQETTESVIEEEQSSEASEQQNSDSETQGDITSETEEQQETEASITEEEQNSDSETQDEIIGETEAAIKTEVVD